jgi:hypothetical protein
VGLFERPEAGYVDSDMSKSVSGTDSSLHLLLQGPLNVAGLKLEGSEPIECLKGFFSNLGSDFTWFAYELCIETDVEGTCIIAADLALY